MNVEASIGRRSMCCIRFRIDMTPEEFQSMLTNLRAVETKSSASFSVASKAFIAAMEAAANPTKAGQ